MSRKPSSPGLGRVSVVLLGFVLTASACDGANSLVDDPEAGLSVVDQTTDEEPDAVEENDEPVEAEPEAEEGEAGNPPAPDDDDSEVPPPETDESEPVEETDDGSETDVETDPDDESEIGVKIEEEDQDEDEDEDQEIIEEQIEIDPPELEPDQIIYQVAPELVGCGNIANAPCMMVRETNNDSWQFFYSSIEGFNYEEGKSYEILVRTTPVENPPADGSSVRYTLLKILSVS